MKKNVRIVVVLFIGILAAVSYILSDFVLAHFKEDLTSLSIEKAKIAVSVSVPIINDAVRNLDDISLIDRVQSLSKIDCISSSFITDSSGKVLINNDVNQTNIVKTDKPYTNALLNKGELLQALDSEKTSFLYSYPLPNDEILFCVIAAQTDKSLIRFMQVKYLLICAVFICGFAFLLLLLSKIFILKPFDNLQKIIVKKADEDFAAAKQGLSGAKKSA
ncbi:MAG: hypothetical protein LBV16_09450, partial [Elusimicrobiota bacterium]|nr:hypothetical protein [Elusimicrobiota bacterium]